ncbi:hypothetical protein [Sphingomonas glaciei]|uniref:DUF2178 domain-containing protein n=1 Tax=Sphingomonas glaciei TaxID=2938948 RepID=A0ABY5N1M2_9SPHN|nr:hypothetical protein [Sphingomonas glaciei]UUR09198.1 hypothetical protein M1K48_06190 [Sphingomonas glaciei]
MSETNALSAGGKGRKILLQLVVGGICGGVGMFAALTLFEGRSGAEVRPVDAVAIGTALIYGLMALIVLLGAMAPGIGARALNVEDREELEEQRSVLVIGAVSFVLVAALVGVLAAAGTGMIAAVTATLVAAGATLGLIGWSILHRNHGDEMMRAAAKDAGVATTNLIFLVFGIWAGAAQLGLVPMFEPLLFVAGYFLIYLLAVFIAVGRRGLLRPR